MCYSLWCNAPTMLPAGGLIRTRKKNNYKSVKKYLYMCIVLYYRCICQVRQESKTYFFYAECKYVYRVPCTVYRVPCTVYRVPFTVYRVPCTVYRLPCTVYPPPKRIKLINHRVTFWERSQVF